MFATLLTWDFAKIECVLIELMKSRNNIFMCWNTKFIINHRLNEYFFRRWFNRNLVWYFRVTVHLSSMYMLYGFANPKLITLLIILEPCYLFSPPWYAYYVTVVTKASTNDQWQFIASDGWRVWMILIWGYIALNRYYIALKATLIKIFYKNSIFFSIQISI